MKRSRIILTTAAMSALLVGCQHHHATTQIASRDLSESNTAASDHSTANAQAPSDSTEIAVSPAGSSATTAPSRFSRATDSTGHAVGEGARDVGHGAAVAGRETGHVFMQGVRGTGEFLATSAVGIRNTPPESLSAPTIDVDEAMQLRDGTQGWDAINCYYRNGSTVAGPIGFQFQPAPGISQPQAAVVEPFLFLINTVIWPAEYFRIAPWDPVQWKGSTIEPTYTAVPPLPPE